LKRYFARVEYDGSHYSGWQVQPDRVTVQSVLEEKMAIIARVPVSTICGGRTDAGVHARGQSVHFDLPESVDISRFQRGINSLLPYSIAMYDITEVSSDFHARFSATRREYLYTIVTRKSPLLSDRSMYVTYSIDWKRVEHEASLLLGEHHFTSFCAVGYYSDNHRCSVECAEISYPSEGVVTLKLRADRFVYNMVRTIVGTLIDMGRGKITCSMTDVINAKDRNAAGFTASAQGLTFDWVYYDA